MNKPKTFQQATALIVSELTDIMYKKQKDYGHGNITDFGETGVLIRLNDKVNRLKNLHKLNSKPVNESIDDSWKDIANYAIIALMLRKGIFTLPLK